MRICFDLDNTLCFGEPYDVAVPIEGAAQMLIDLKNQGHTILIYTARGMGRGKGNVGVALATIGAMTFNQLDKWKFIYDEVFFGKPDADIFFDDKAFGFTGMLDCNSMSDIIRSIELADKIKKLSLKTSVAISTIE